jgi:hypothetical protein
MYRLVGEGGGDPLVERDFQAWQEASRLNPMLAEQIARDALVTLSAVRRGLVSSISPVDGLPMPIIMDRLTDSQKPLQ